MHQDLHIIFIETKRITHMLIFYQCKFVENFQERANLGLVNKCLSQGQTFDPTIFDSDESDENSRFFLPIQGVDFSAQC